MNAKKVIGSIMIFAAGAALGFFAAKKLLEDKYAQLAQDEIDSVKEMFTRTSAERLTKQIKIAKDIQERGKNPTGDLTRNSLTEGVTPYNRVITRYHEMAKEDIRKSWDTEAGMAREISNEENDEIDEETEEDFNDEPLTDAAGYSESDFVDEIGERDLSNIDRTKPYMISDTEFHDEFDHHDKLSLYYYSDDDILCDEGENIVEDVDYTVGDEALYLLIQNKQSCVWVRNEPLAVDYEICVIHSSYAEMIHGITIEDRFKNDNKHRKAKKEEDDE